MRHLKRSLLAVPLLVIAACAIGSFSTYAHASPSDHGGVTASAVDTHAPCSVDAAAPFDVQPMPSAGPAEPAHRGDVPIVPQVAEDRRPTLPRHERYVSGEAPRGCPPYQASLTAMTYSTVTIAPDGAILVRPQRLNC